MTHRKVSWKTYSKAAALIKKHGLHKGGYGSARGGYCALGACRTVQKKSLNEGSEELVYAKYHELKTVLPYGTWDTCIASYSDYPLITAEDVQESLMAAASLALSEEYNGE